MRPTQDGTAGSTGFMATATGFSATPIYDALYSEYRRSFRSLPGDRSGEEDLGFRGFGTHRLPGQSGLYAHQGGGWSAYALPPGRRTGP
ncbi:hypothetical protein KV205_19090 [Streptomyces sp. SKN60]|uniref:hypothetical protein n=1 Tax=Streptomyces sp. SKN60 TaxID=2855506 RepID=UPI002245DEAA|nr:hypothetical protein [Streptomyces sp. SKN60]MCX2182618.1 hypothetical protein [Streptomyces sp. SKN60]